MNNRIKKIRKSLNLSQTEFGKALGLKASSVSDIENGRCKVSEQVKLAVINAYNVDSHWLETGEGDNMFLEIPDNIINELALQYKLSEMEKKIVESFITLDQEERAAVVKLIKKINE